MGSIVQTITKLCNPMLHFSDWKSMGPRHPPPIFGKKDKCAFSANAQSKLASVVFDKPSTAHLMVSLCLRSSRINARGESRALALKGAFWSLKALRGSKIRHQVVTRRNERAKCFPNEWSLICPPGKLMSFNLSGPPGHLRCIVSTQEAIQGSETKTGKVSDATKKNKIFHDKRIIYLPSRQTNDFFIKSKQNKTLSVARPGSHFCTVTSDGTHLRKDKRPMFNIGILRAKLRPFYVCFLQNWHT